MKEQFATYEVSKQLKELGFDLECLKWYPNSLGHLTSDHIFLQYDDEKDFAYAPLWQQVKQWLWEKHNISIEVRPRFSGFYWAYFNNNSHVNSGNNNSASPITAEIEGITAAVNYLHKQLPK